MLDHVGADPDGTVHRVALTQLFRYQRGAWTPINRAQYCQAGVVPAAIEYLTCQTS